MIYKSIDSNGQEVININVGDDGEITISLASDTGGPYTMASDEYLIFNVREKPTEDSELLIDIRSENGSNDIVISHNDTANLEPGYYSAEVQLMANDGKRITVWPKLEGTNKTSKSNRKNFCLMTEVVYQ